MTLITADHVIAHEEVRGFVEIEDGAVVINDDMITYVGPRATAPTGCDETIMLGESVLMPGLIDLDALADIDHLQLDSWASPAMEARQTWSTDYFAARREVLTPSDRQVMRRYALVQLALHGITTFMPIASEVHTVWAESADDLMDVARLAQEIGLRAFLGPSYRSGTHVTDHDGADAVAWQEHLGEEGFAGAVRFLDAVAELDDPRLTGILAPCRIETVREDLLRRTAEISQQRDVLVRVHALQSVHDAEQTHSATGATELELLERVGLLNPRTIIAHGVYIDVHPDVAGEDRGDLRTMANAGMSVIHCPLTNIRYAMNLDKLSRYLDAGVNIALGTDSFPPDLIRGIDQGVQLAKAQHGGLSHGMLAEYIEAATLGGARALRRPDLGKIAPGATADLVAFALDDFRIGVVEEDPLRSLVLAGTGRDAVFSMVAGRVVMRDGQIKGIDLEDLRREGQRIFGLLRAAYAERDYLHGSPDELFPPIFERQKGDEMSTGEDNQTNLVRGLRALNAASEPSITELILETCHLPVRRWAVAVAAARPYATSEALIECAQSEVGLLTDQELNGTHDELTRFTPRSEGTDREARWSRQEAAGLSAGDDAWRLLDAAQDAYEAKFGHVILVSATGLSTQELAAAVDLRTQNTPEQESDAVRRELRKLLAIRLPKLLTELGEAG